jgi:hypothetical protein
VVARVGLSEKTLSVESERSKDYAASNCVIGSQAGGEMKIVVLAERFENGAWGEWQHACDKEEVESVIDSANATAADRMQSQPSYIDYLTGAAYIFNVAYGSREEPREGDTRVYGAIVDEILIGIYDKIERHFRSAA